MITKVEISNTDNLIDIRDVIERVEALEDSEDSDEQDELRTLTELLEECKGYGGDEKWRGDWYPVTLIRDTYFMDYAQELAEEMGARYAAADWPMNCIDWEQAARELKYDYIGLKFGDVRYWTRDV